jgi:hypothetical protein
MTLALDAMEDLIMLRPGNGPKGFIYDGTISIVAAEEGRLEMGVVSGTLVFGCGLRKSDLAAKD